MFCLLAQYMYKWEKTTENIYITFEALLKKTLGNTYIYISLKVN